MDRGLRQQDGQRDHAAYAHDFRQPVHRRHTIPVDKLAHHIKRELAGNEWHEHGWQVHGDRFLLNAGEDFRKNAVNQAANERPDVHPFEKAHAQRGHEADESGDGDVFSSSVEADRAHHPDDAGAKRLNQDHDHNTITPNARPVPAAMAAPIRHASAVRFKPA